MIESSVLCSEMLILTVSDVAYKRVLIMLMRVLDAGKIQKNLENDEDFKTPLQQKLDEFGQQLSKVHHTDERLIVFILD